MSSPRSGSDSSDSSAPGRVRLDEQQLSQIDLGGDYSESEEPRQHTVACRWRTPEFHDQECARFFDCPSHLVERRLSVDEDAKEGTSIIGSYSSTGSSDDNADPTDEGSPIASGPGSDEHDDGQSPAVSPRDSALEPSWQHGQTSPQSLAEAAILADQSDDAVIPSREPSTPASQMRGASATAGSVPRQGNDTQGEPEDDPGSSTPDTARGQSGLGDRSLPVLPNTESYGWSPPSRQRMNAPLPSPRDRTSGEVAARHRGHRHSGVSRRVSSDFALPRWQPDVEITYCPICHTQFSFFVRKHHCRCASSDDREFASRIDKIIGNVEELSATRVRRTESLFHTNTLCGLPVQRSLCLDHCS